MDDATLARLMRDDLAHQDDVVTRAQLEERGASPADLQRFVRRRLLARVHAGVFVGHTGTLTDRQRRWAAVLACGPGAALCRVGDPAPVVHVAIDTRRRVRAPEGVRVHRVAGLAQIVRESASPPRVWPAHDVLLRVESARDEDEVVELLATAVRTRVTTTEGIRAAVERRARLRRRALVLAVLDDIGRGTQSVLEWRYLRDVERAHGLPAASWQRRRVVSGRTEYSDALYETYGLLVELRGRLGHDTWGDRARDARRDLDQAAAGRQTIELVHRQVFRDPCATAASLAALLRQRGWTGVPRRCAGVGCVIAESVAHPMHQEFRGHAG